MRLALVFTIFVTGLSFAADDAGKKELEKLQGTWKVVKAIKDGRAQPEDAVKKMKVSIAGDKLTVDRETTPFVIDPSKKPATIDITVDKKLTLQGIYELDKDTLKICVGLEGVKRPADFKAGENSGCSLLVLEREKK
jgi:uncharacterized protein (TIGR03067 family)